MIGYPAFKSDTRGKKKEIGEDGSEKRKLQCLPRSLDGTALIREEVPVPRHREQEAKMEIKMGRKRREMKRKRKRKRKRNRLEIVSGKGERN